MEVWVLGRRPGPQMKVWDWDRVLAPEAVLGPEMEVQAPNKRLDSGFAVRILKWSSGSWHERLGPRCISICKPQIGVSDLEWTAMPWRKFSFM